MKVRYKDKPEVQGFSDKLNTHGLGEVIFNITEPDYDCTSEYIKELEVEIQGEWVDMQNAFRGHVLVTDNYNTRFREAQTQEEMHRGWYE